MTSLEERALKELNALTMAYVIDPFHQGCLEKDCGCIRCVTKRVNELIVDLETEKGKVK